ncbi:hypothetical protein ABE547_09975 [Dorea sp. YH-dor226]|uniref:hypothetical protein n=1 Tax=Dorea sp. YH-dor226 TaxID=3151119 RepID=UPI0032420075
MKKYVKPDLVYENFELSHTVANCSAALNHAEAETNCFINDIEGIDLGYTVYTAGANCTYGPEVWEDYCKFTGTDGYNVFTS